MTNKQFMGILSAIALVGVSAYFAFLPPLQAAPTQIAPLVATAGTGNLIEAGWDFVPFQTDASSPVTGWYHVKSGQMYDKTNNVLAASPTWRDCVTPITVDSFSGIFEDTPAATMPGGWYIWRLWDSVVPAATDTPLARKLVYWDRLRGQITWIGDL